MKQVASLQYGVIFKKAFSQPDIFTAFVKAVLGIEFSCDKVETEKSFRPAIGNVDSRFDLFAQDTKNPIIVDIQHEKKYSHYDRFLRCITSAANVTIFLPVTNCLFFQPMWLFKTP
ncbi:MAG: hypothetical protein QX199_17975 [Methylococcaceae bacterium]